MKVTVTVALEVNASAWQDEYRTTGEQDTVEDVRARVRELIAGSHPSALGLWRTIDHPSGWAVQSRSTAGRSTR